METPHIPDTSNTSNKPKRPTSKLERLEVFEERAGVKLEALFAIVDHSTGYSDNNDRFLPSIRINGEIHPREGTTLLQRVKIVADAYNASGRLICTNSTSSFNPETFYGYETFSLCVGGIHPNEIVKIRVYPKLGF